MSTPELEEYAQSGKLPNWFPNGPAVTESDYNEGRSGRSPIEKT